MAKKINEDDFWSNYKPQINHLERAKQPDSVEDEDICSWAGCMYETYGEDISYILSLANDKTGVNYKRVWTIIECEDTFVVSAGYHLVNRMGYLVTENPWDDPDDEVVCEL